MLPDWLNPKVWIESIFQAKYVKSVSRTILAFLSGILLTKVGLDPQIVADFIAKADPVVVALLGKAILAITGVWSLADKKKNQE